MKVEVAVLGSPSLISLMGFCGCNATLKQNPIEPSRKKRKKERKKEKKKKKKKRKEKRKEKKNPV